jgi:zinc transport system ATP-binding protein
VELAESTTPGSVFLRTRDLGVRYGSVWALKGIDLEIRRGDLLAFIGPNGAGKSTLLKALIGLVEPTTGTMERVASGLRLAYVPQKLAFDLSFPITVGEFLTVSHPGRFLWWGGVSRRYRAAIAEVLDRLQVREQMHQKLGTLSGGQLQRVLIAAALLQNPELLLLDEPAASIDRRGAEELQELLRSLHEREGMTLVFVSHDLHFVDHLARTVLCLNQTACAVGSPQEVLTEAHLSTTYGSHGGLWMGGRKR